MESAILFVGHGSRDPEGTEGFQRLVDLFRQQEPRRIVEGGFLEFARPIFAESVAACVRRGARQIIVLPGMLMAAGHAKNDIPSEIHEARQRYPGIEFHYGRHLHLHDRVLELCRLRLEEVEHQARPHDREDTLLMVVGRGSSDPDANADVQKLARLLWEGMGFGWGAASYIGVTTPLLPDALQRCQRLEFGRILVMPFFLFTGILEKRIRNISNEFDRRCTGREVLCADSLGVHPLLIEVFRERVQEALHGSPSMNCDLCKYRVQLPGFAEAVGEPQKGHHHHVRGIGQDDHHSSPDRYPT